MSTLRITGEHIGNFGTFLVALGILTYIGSLYYVNFILSTIKIVPFIIACIFIVMGCILANKYLHDVGKLDVGLILLLSGIIFFFGSWFSMKITPFIIACIFIVVGLFLFQHYDLPENNNQMGSFSNETIEAVDWMDGKEFENYMGEVYRAFGYTVLNTKLSGDQGADLIISKDGMKKAVQTKRSNKKVTNKAIQEVVAAKSHYGCNSAVVVTNNYFTTSAIELAESNHVILVDRDWLIEMLESTLKRVYAGR